MGINWKYLDKDFTEDMIGDDYGFVYIITNLINNRKYIGKKFFYSLRTKIIKGKKKRVKLPSDWQTYYGSNDVIKKFGEIKKQCLFFELPVPSNNDIHNILITYKPSITFNETLDIFLFILLYIVFNGILFILKNYL
jgi:hypothetical protein